VTKAKARASPVRTIDDARMVLEPFHFLHAYAPADAAYEQAVRGRGGPGVVTGRRGARGAVPA